MSNEITKYKQRIITKIKKFLKKLFGIKENIEESSNKKTNTIEKNSFRENIELKQDEEEQKILKLQKEYKLGNIREEDMTDEEHQKLIALYEKQNKILEEKINTKKTIIRKKIDELKAS